MYELQWTSAEQSSVSLDLFHLKSKWSQSCGSCGKLPKNHYSLHSRTDTDETETSKASKSRPIPRMCSVMIFWSFATCVDLGHGSVIILMSNETSLMLQFKYTSLFRSFNLKMGTRPSEEGHKFYSCTVHSFEKKLVSTCTQVHILGLQRCRRNSTCLGKERLW